MDKKKGLIIGGSAAGAALIALVVSSLVLANRPNALIIRAAANTISDAKRIEIIDLADDVANGGSIAVSANLDKLANDDVYAEAKIYTNAANLKSAYELTLTEDDDVILNSKAMFNEGKFAFSCPELFDGTYGVNYRNLAKNLPGSIFDPDEETDYSLDDEQFERYLNLNDTVKNDKNLQRDVTNMTAKYRQVAIKTFVKYAEVGRGSKTITVGGEKINCTVITLTLDEEALAAATRDIIEYANNDKDLEKLLYRVASNSMYTDPDEYVDNFFDSLDEMDDALDNLEDEDIELSMDFYITKSGRRLARLDAEVEVDRERTEFSILLGKNVKTSKEISLTASNSDGDTYSITYTVKENSAKAYEAELEFSEGDSRYGYEDKVVFKVEWDKKSGDFVFKYKDDYDNLVIKGNLLQKGDKYIFELTNIRTGNSPVPYVKTLELTITIDRNDPMPNVPARFTEITTMNERDFKHLKEDIEDGINKIEEEYFEH